MRNECPCVGCLGLAGSAPRVARCRPSLREAVRVELRSPDRVIRECSAGCPLSRSV
jgi:hypothetical protein